MELNHATNSKGIGLFKNFDPEHTQTWPLPKILTGLVLVVSIYLVLVRKLLPTYMVSRSPLRLKRVLLAYNVLQVALSSYTFLLYLQYIHNYGVITTRCPKGADLREVANKIFPYFLAKHLDLLDTVFFVLRKKENQVTFLHVYHHTTMVAWGWLYYLYHPCDNFVVVGMLNTFVHVLMYAYYAMSSLGPKYAKYVWWKKHLTKIQLIQFTLILWNMYYQQKVSPCPVPGFFYKYAMLVTCSYFYLFIKFYLTTYMLVKVNNRTKNSCFH